MVLFPFTQATKLQLPFASPLPDVTIFIEPPMTRFQYATSDPDPPFALNTYLHCPDGDQVFPTPFLKPKSGPYPYFTVLPY